MNKEIVIKPNYIFADYYKIYLSLYFNKLSNKIISTIIILITIFNIYSVLNKDVQFSEIFSTSFTILISYPFLIFFIKYKQTKIILNNPKLKENILIKLNQAGYEFTGESYNIKYNWKEIKKITEKKDWFILNISKNDFKLIRKADLKNNQYEELKNLFNQWQ
jgi:hypothetical protein